MIQTLSPIIAEYISAGNGRDEETFLACFAPDAAVTDEDTSRVGTEEIRKWYRETRDAYNFTAAVKSFEEDGDQTLLVCTVKGNFPGSPVDLSYRFRLIEGRIAELTIV